MDLTEQRRQDQNKIIIFDSLNGALMSIKVCPLEGVVTPDSNELIISVGDAQAGLGSSNGVIKNYVYNLSRPLCYSEEDYGEFHQEVNIVNNEVQVRAYVEWSGDYGTMIEELEPIDILLFKGYNIIQTNYQNVDIELIYPQNNDFNKTFLNTTIYNNHRKINDSLSLDDLYFKDAFTKMDDELNETIDNLNVKCITSKNEKFSLDNEGNLTVNSITTNQYNNILDKVYPVGSIYMSVNSTNPSTLFGGTWSEWGVGRVPVGVDVNDSQFNLVEKIGGEKNHLLTINEMPCHAHDLIIHKGGSTDLVGIWGMNGGIQSTTLAGASQWGIKNTGGSQPHNNLQPYITCYMWKRIE